MVPNKLSASKSHLSDKITESSLFVLHAFNNSAEHSVSRYIEHLFAYHGFCFNSAFLLHGLVPCSICWCWLLTANLLTCTGMGTTILGFLTGSPERLLTLPALIRFHLALRF